MAEPSGGVRSNMGAPVAEAVEVERYLEGQKATDLLRFITCGSVDDGKSTLIGRLLYESKLVFSDQLASLSEDSKRFGTQGGDLDFALLVDGLAAEREQGITIDVAYRFFATEHRRFIVADTPGHEQYTRNMVTGASTADLAIILIDARKGVLTQTRRHSYLVSLLGIEHVVVAVNKLDLVDYDEGTFRAIESEYREFAERLGMPEVTCVPLSALRGDNLTELSLQTPWYTGPTLIDHLETVPGAESAASRGGFRMPVQWVNRPNLDFRGVSGTVVGGTLRPGDRIHVMPGETQTTVERIVTAGGDLGEAVTDQSVTVTLADEIDVSRGDLLVAVDDPSTVARQFQAHVVWMDQKPMLGGGRYLLKCGTRSVPAAVSPPKYVININTLDHNSATTLHLNEIGVCTVTTDEPIAFDPYKKNRDTGGFILIDRLNNATVAAGLIDHDLRRSTNVQWQQLEVSKESRATRNGHRPAVVWFTGLSGSGKSTIANLLEKLLQSAGIHTFMLDGDNIRHGVNRDLGFTDADRVENVRRIAEIAQLMAQAGLVVLVAAISPFRADRDEARRLADDGEFFEVFVDTPLAVAERRDPKHLYRKARAGDLPHFTGIDSPYEIPLGPEVHIDTMTTDAETAAHRIFDVLASARVCHPIAPDSQLG